MGRLVSFSYVGGKYRTRKKIMALFPDQYDTYIEPFLGSGQIFLNIGKRTGTQYIINDKNKDIYHMWKDFQSLSPEEVKHLRFSFISKEEFQELMAMASIKNKLERLYRNMMLSFYSFSGNRKNYYNYLVYRKGDRGAMFLKNFPSLHAYLHGVKILNQDYKAVIRKYDGPNTLMYLDPPYVEKERYYTGLSIDPYEMAAFLRTVKGKFVLSYNNVPEVREAFQGFSIEKVPFDYSLDTTRSKVYELLIKNF